VIDFRNKDMDFNYFRRNWNVIRYKYATKLRMVDYL